MCSLPLSLTSKWFKYWSQYLQYPRAISTQTQTAFTPSTQSLGGVGKCSMRFLCRHSSGHSSTRHFVRLPRSLLADRGAVLRLFADGAGLHLEECLTHPGHIAAPAARDSFTQTNCTCHFSSLRNSFSSKVDQDTVCLRTRHCHVYDLEASRTASLR